MKFWGDKSLKVRAAYVLAVLVMMFIAEYFVVKSSLYTFSEAETKIDFARSVQVENQRIALQVSEFIHGKEILGATIVSALDHEDHLLKILGDGGRIDGSEKFLKPLSRLPRITYDNLKKNWNTYRAAVTTIITRGESTDAMGSDDEGSTDSTVTVQVMSVQEKKMALQKARLIFDAQWLQLSSWYQMLIDDLEEEVASREAAVLNWFSAFIIMDIVALILVMYYFYRHVLNPLGSLETNTANQTHSRGLPDNEIGAVAIRINKTIEELKDATEFVLAIGDGRLDLSYQSLDAQYAPGKNKLADSLIDMQTRLKAVNEEERKRQWSNEGLAKFVDILRSSNDNLTLLGDKIISALVQYTKSNQGGLYILNDEDKQNKYLELISLFAFDIKKFEQQKIRLGEGILGQTFLEKETTYLTNLPDTFVRITSGLGDANPKSILMVPLKVDTEVYGIIELATFSAYAPHEIAFVEKLGESIASTLESVRAAQRNRQLIEQFQQQTEQMRAQEEEMRQNMEELQATQEEIARKEKSYVARIEELETQAGGITQEEIERLKAEVQAKERDYEKRIQTLTAQARSDDWEIALEIEKALKINLEALQIAREELDKKARE
jgi:GAF domain-containing protein